ncbi:glycosyltransferase involved in cell wall biosynthesis [Bradyrhizobium sp. ERR14]|nr:glycosyltransferase involved in cell wall biosynthesis [Bradyrhizobium sp. ERR14]
MTADVFIIGHVNLLPLAGLVRCLRPKLSILLFVHGDEVWNEPKRRRKRWYDKSLLRAVDVIASVSQYTADVMSQKFGLDAAKFEVFPNAVDEIEAVCEAERDKPIILTVSRMSAGDRDKNIHQMLRAVAILKRKLPRVQYYIVGDGALRSEHEKLSGELNIDENVSFLGRVSDVELSQVYQQASVFAMPSSKEGFGIVYLEAWLYSLPVICSTFGASKEIVSDGVDGFVVDHRDERQLAERLHQLLTDKMLAMELGRNGRNKVQTKYLNSSFRSNLEALLEKTLRRSYASE